jgi:hypothetical protein
MVWRGIGIRRPKRIDAQDLTTISRKITKKNDGKIRFHGSGLEKSKCTDSA